MCDRWPDLQRPVIALLNILLFEFEERLSGETARDVVDGCGDTAFAFEAVDFLHHLIDRVSVCDIGLDAHSFASGFVDLGYQWLVVGGCAGQESDWVFFGEAAGD